MKTKTDYYTSQTEKLVKEFDKMTKYTAKSLNQLYDDLTQEILEKARIEFKCDLSMYLISFNLRLITYFF